MKMEHAIQSFDYLYEQKPIKKLSLQACLLVDQQLYWLDDGLEKVFHEIGLSIKFVEVSVHSKIKYFRVYVNHHLSVKRSIRLFIMYHNPFTFADNMTFISPSEKIIYHIEGDAVYMVNGTILGDQYTEASVIPFWNMKSESMWLSEGKLKYQPMRKGNALSVYAHDLDFPGKGMKEGDTWVVKGDNKCEVEKLNRLLFKNTLAFPNKK